jgi:hypothetical protein
MRHRIAAGFCLAIMVGVSGVSAGGKLKSGPQVGENLPGIFDPLNITGEKAGEVNCLV